MALQKLKDARLSLDLEKYEFSVKKTNYLGFIKSSEGSIPFIRIDPEKKKTYDNY